MAETTAIHRSLVKTLLELHNTCGSGVVRVQRGPEKKQLVVRNGCLAFTESNLQNDHLARVLVRMNLLPRTSLAKIAALMKEGKTSDRAILEASSLSGSDIEQGAREQAVQILASLFGWQAAEVHCYRADVTTMRPLNLALPLPELLVLSARRATAQRTVPSYLKTLKGTLAPDPAFVQDLLALPLDSGEALAFSHVQQPARTESLLPSLAGTGVEAEELLQRLLLLGFIRFQDSSAETGPEAAKATPGEAEGLMEQLDEQLRRFEVANLYEILSVKPEATDSDIKTAYHELAKQFHPDRFQSKEFSAEIRSKAQKVFTHITGAYRTLGDPARREGYDAERLKKGGLVEAALQARSTIDLDREKMADALYHAGRMALRREEFEKAAEQFRECVWLRPEVARYHQYLGTAQAEIPRMRKEAEQHLLKAIELNTMQTDTYLTLGKLYLKVNLPRRAEMQFQEALRWNPSNLEAQSLLQELAAGGGGPSRKPRQPKTPL